MSTREFPKRFDYREAATVDWAQEWNAGPPAAPRGTRRKLLPGPLTGVARSTTNLWGNDIATIRSMRTPIRDTLWLIPTAEVPLTTHTEGVGDARLGRGPLDAARVLQRQGVKVAVVHGDASDPHQLRDALDQVLVMAGGRMQAFGPKNEVLSKMTRQSPSRGANTSRTRMSGPIQRHGPRA